MKKIILASVVLIILGIGGFLTYHGRIKAHINNQLMMAARHGEAQLYFKETALSPLALSYKNLTLSLPRVFVDIIFEELNIIPAWFQVFRLSPAAKITGKLYSGSLDGAVKMIDLKRVALQKIVLNNLSIGEHPIINRLGFGGTVNIMADFESDLTRFKFQLANGTYDKAIPFHVPYQGNLLTITLPGLSDINITATGEHSGANLRLTSANVISNLGQGDCTGKYDMVDKIASIKCKVSLSSAGISELESYLVLASNGVLSAATPRFIVKVQYNKAHRRLTREFEILSQ